MTEREKERERRRREKRGEKEREEEREEREREERRKGERGRERGEKEREKREGKRERRGRERERRGREREREERKREREEKKERGREKRGRERGREREEERREREEEREEESKREERREREERERGRERERRRERLSLSSSSLTGELDDCFCDVESIDVFNNFKIFPKIKKLTERDYFRYYRVNLKRPCPFWADDSHCSIKDCHVEPCPESKVPVGIKSGNYNKYSQAVNSESEVTECEQAKELGAINSTLSNQSKKAFADWARHDDAQDHFCELDDETSPDADYVDLLLNPERFTGYKGSSAWRVWNSIYEENCFKPRSVYRPLYPLVSSRGDDDGESFYNWLEGLCLEKRVFYRLISGLHSSINIHLSAEYLLDGWGRSVWGPNVVSSGLFQRVLGPGTVSCGPNVAQFWFFLCLQRVWPRQTLWGPKGQFWFISVFFQSWGRSAAFSLHFDDESMPKPCKGLRLWTTQGLGTALKILFSEREIQSLST
ncbi:hypothetical protein WMY93_006799 [Mugilogobius chulae]|uniref:Uncharacterized protein n=1 Tax=Mugilogobius chulae TaxID=88201 RepID=A0AAW0PPC0_9GOBI